MNRVATFLVEIGSLYLKWPSHHEAETISSKFENIKGIPNVIGAIDGTHIKIRAPTQYPQDYFNRKKYYSIAMQVVVDANKKFIDVYCGEPGSLHDSRILRRSELYRRCEENMNQFFPNNMFILGDSAYPVKPWIVPPFKDNGGLTDAHRRFNKVHSSTRVVVENSIGLLKNRFRRILNFTEQLHINLIVNIIYATCVLHNMCIMQDDNFEITSDSELINNNEEDQSTIHGVNRQQLLFQELCERNVI